MCTCAQARVCARACVWCALGGGQGAISWACARATRHASAACIACSASTATAARAWLPELRDAQRDCTQSQPEPCLAARRAARKAAGSRESKRNGSSRQSTAAGQTAANLQRPDDGVAPPDGHGHKVGEALQPGLLLPVRRQRLRRRPRRGRAVPAAAPLRLLHVRAGGGRGARAAKRRQGRHWAGRAVLGGGMWVGLGGRVLEDLATRAAAQTRHTSAPPPFIPAAPIAPRMRWSCCWMPLPLPIWPTNQHKPSAHTSCGHDST